MGKALPLRETKKAKTRINLYLACLELIREKPYRSVLVDDLCQRAEISKATFFNFFAQKEDLLLYVMQIWISRRHIEIIQEQKRGIAAIRHLLQQIHIEAQLSPYGMLGLISFLSESRTLPSIPQFTEVEKQLLFGSCDDSLDFTELTLSKMFHQYIDEAKADRQIADQSPTLELVQVMFTIFYGGFLTAHLMQTKDVMAVYERHLALLLEGKEV